MIQLPLRSIRPLLTRLDLLRETTRHRTWPSGEPLNIALFGISCDTEHVKLALDAIATFHPGSTLSIFFDRLPELFLEGTPIPGTGPPSRIDGSN
jgi:hypothetical protein